MLYMFFGVSFSSLPADNNSDEPCFDPDGLPSVEFREYNTLIFEFS